MSEGFIFNSLVAVIWILFIALFPISFIWFRRAYRIIFKKDYSEVVVKKGVPPKNPKKWAPFVAILNLIAACILLLVIVKVSIFAYYYKNINFIAATFMSWSEVAGITIWSKIIIDFIMRQQAHPMKFGRKKNKEVVST
jgi:hypothetical protein